MNKVLFDLYLNNSIMLYGTSPTGSTRGPEVTKTLHCTELRWSTIFYIIQWQFILSKKKSSNHFGLLKALQQFRPTFSALHPCCTLCLRHLFLCCLLLSSAGVIETYKWIAEKWITLQLERFLRTFCWFSIGVQVAIFFFLQPPLKTNRRRLSIWSIT